MSPLLTEARLLLSNDLRLYWRDLRTGRSKAFTNGILIALVLLAFHAISLFAFWHLHTTPPIGLEAGLWAFFGFLMLGASMNHAISLFFERADFDLLLASPIHPRAILLSRISVMAVSAIFGAGLLLLPLLDGIVIGFSASYAAGYVVWLLLATLVACVGIWVTLILVRTLGLRRARTWIQVIAAVLGASIFISFQIQNYLDWEQKKKFIHVLEQLVNTLGLSHIALAGRGAPVQLLTLLGITVTLTVLTARQLAQIFLGGLQESSISSAPAKKSSSRAYTFHDGPARVTFKKDLRLITRDPLLLSQILPSLLYIMPAFLALRNFGPHTVLAPISIVFAVQFSTLLTDLSASGEECLDLIQMSPSPEVQLRLAKMAAGMALPVCLATAICLAIAVVGHPWIALLALFTAIANAAGTSWLCVTSIQPTARKDILGRRRRRMSIGRSIVTGVLMISACGGISMVAHGQLWLVGLALLGANILGVIACFTLVSVSEIVPPADSSAWKLPPATTS